MGPILNINGVVTRVDGFIKWATGAIISHQWSYNPTALTGRYGFVFLEDSEKKCNEVYNKNTLR